MHNGSFINNWNNNVKAVSFENNYIDELCDNVLTEQYKKKKRKEKQLHSLARSMPSGASQTHKAAHSEG